MQWSGANYASGVLREGRWFERYAVRAYFLFKYMSDGSNRRSAPPLVVRSSRPQKPIGGQPKGFMSI